MFDNRCDAETQNYHSFIEKFGPPVTSTLQAIGHSLYRIAATITQISLSIIIFPLRYIGSKTWFLSFDNGRIQFRKTTGYHTTMEKISRDKLCNALRYAAACNMAHSKYTPWMEPFGFTRIAPKDLNLDRTKLPNSLIAKDDCFFDKKTGLKVDLMKNNTTNEVIVTYGAFTSTNSELNYWHQKKIMLLHQGLSVISTFFGTNSQLFDRALLLQNAIAKAMPDKKITITGHSQGGALAQYVGF